MVNRLHDDLQIKSKFIQSREQLLAHDYNEINNTMISLLDRFATL